MGVCWGEVMNKSLGIKHNTFENTGGRRPYSRTFRYKVISPGALHIKISEAEY